MPLEKAPFPPGHEYELLDFGHGRKLERFGGLILDRPSPAAENEPRAAPDLWNSADFVFQAETRKRPRAPEAETRKRPGELPNPPGLPGRLRVSALKEGESGWTPDSNVDDWRFRGEQLVLELHLSPFGHVGLFPEQIANWRWLKGAVRQAERPVNALNLFGYTGGSSLSMASAGAKVVHVDASQPTVRWAKRNAELSGLTERPIRWIVDDVREFVQREIRRGSKYDIIAMDPPAYGHGSDGKDWKIEIDLDPLIEDCMKLLNPAPIAFLLTGHSPIPSLDVGPLSSASWKRLTKAFPCVGRHRVGLLDTQRRKLDFGYAYRFRN